ncbi:MAG: hypothetical protein AAF368_15305, partial [Planctomycetota bacterium]
MRFLGHRFACKRNLCLLRVHPRSGEGFPILAEGDGFALLRGFVDIVVVIIVLFRALLLFDLVVVD